MFTDVIDSDGRLFKSDSLEISGKKVAKKEEKSEKTAADLAGCEYLRKGWETATARLRDYFGWENGQK